MVGKFSALEDQAKKVVNDVSGVTNRIKENPSLLLRSPKKEEKENAETGMRFANPVRGGEH